MPESWQCCGRFMPPLRRLSARGRFLPPDSSKQAADQAARLGSDILEFIADRCVIDDDAHVEKGALYSAYVGWCQANNIRTQSANWFGQSLREASSVTDFRPRNSEGKPIRSYKGICLIGQGGSSDDDG